MSVEESRGEKEKSAQKPKQAPEQIYLQYAKPVYYVAYSILHNREDAEDITHDVFAAFLSLADSNRIKDVKSYLLKMAQNKSLNYQKRRERECPTEDAFAFDCPLTEDPEEDLMLRRIADEIKRLPEEEQQVFLLHVKAGMKLWEVSKVTGLSLSAVYRRYRKALRILQERMRKYE